MSEQLEDHIRRAAAAIAAAGISSEDALAAIEESKRSGVLKVIRDMGDPGPAS